MRLFCTNAFRATALALAGVMATPLGAGLIPATAKAYPAPPSFADLADKLLPAVVNISSSTTLTARNNPGPDIPLFPPGSPFEQFFKDFLDRNRRGGPDRGQREQPPLAERRLQSLGSGFIIDPEGLVVTNNHVIDGADEITVTLQDNTSLKATVIGRDEREDIALLRVKSDKPLPAVQFGNSDAERVGDWVLAIGNPFGLGGTVTAGIVSARGRDIHQGPYDDFIQTDAAINRGNSGGPLFNMSGEVIGINTAIYSPSGGSIGIGFSIPANMAKNVVAQLRDYGHARRGWLGVRIQQVTPDIAESLGLHNPNGAMVAGVNDSGPADQAHIRNGDIILKFNGQDVKEMRALPRIVAETPIGKEVPVTIWRDGREQSASVKVGELPDDQQLAAATPGGRPSPSNPRVEISGLGLQLAPMTPEARDKYQLGADQKGVVVTDVTPNSPAADRGVKPGDVILEVQQEEVSTPADVQRRVDDVRKQNRKSVLVLIQGQDGLRWVPLPLTGELQRKPG
ncbi:MAG: DegQ family serine endoprotease [Acetobacteraceae bacterium]|nr:DegQ family serine endoprotease [Acetobacteraceae bacterium]MBV8525842.1 DegQ family serine endoprotease [Acetobacteraceae bacterium]